MGVNKQVVELPIFSGDDPTGWLFRAERYFAINGITVEKRVISAAVCMEGMALVWFQWVEARKPNLSWGEFQNMLLERFRSSQDGTAYEELIGLRQLSSVADYRHRFELLSAPLKDMSDELLMGAFINGLREEVKAKLILIGPKDLAHASSLAQKIEDKNLILERN